MACLATKIGHVHDRAWALKARVSLKDEDKSQLQFDPDQSTIRSSFKIVVNSVTSGLRGIKDSLTAERHY